MSRGFLLVAFAFFINMVGATLPTPLYPLYERDFHIAPDLIPVIFAVYSIGVIGGLLFFGHQSDRIGRRTVLIPALAFSALSAIAFWMAHGLALIFAGRVLSGLSAGVFTGAGTAAMVDYATQANRRFFSLIAAMTNLLGLGCGTLFSGLLAQYAPPPLRTPYWADLALLLPAIAGLGTVKETVANARGRIALSLQRLRVPREIRTTFIRAAIAGMSAFAVSGVFSAVAPEIVGRDIGGDSPAIAGALVFLLFSASGAGQLFIDSIPREFAFPTGCASLIAGLVLLAGSVGAHSLALLFLSAAFCGVGQGIAMGFGLANINERITERRGEVISAYFVLLYIGLSIPVVALGFLASVTGLAIAAYIFCGVVGAFVAAVIAWR